MDFENINIWCWLIPLLVGLISGILGYLWGKGNNTAIDNSAEIKALEDKSIKLQADLEACNKKLADASKEFSTTPPTATSLTEKSKVIAFNGKAAQAALGKKVKQDDLKIVEGIGPKIEQLFHSFDIKTWKALSEASVAKCQEVLDSGGDRYRIHDPSSWPMQAKMAYQGRWKGLIKWQDEHKAGKF
ncbi:hypothetical protein [Allomuricauda sp. SCSIO 65647]|uniref:hypothetical protein n=1 Tax=Allomuricauda sp. SCSIO 65647 TaxID=2908843 RepID=UPI001F397228|nr:hypothetical protein [Muricauda sp. SCSIO 65647]UJH66031.1 hypothetical protein L0P89_08580 [Muricauda sp. SCSIO 65647]